MSAENKNTDPWFQPDLSKGILIDYFKPGYYIGPLSRGFKEALKTTSEIVGIANKGVLNHAKQTDQKMTDYLQDCRNTANDIYMRIGSSYIFMVSVFYKGQEELIKQISKRK